MNYNVMKRPMFKMGGKAASQGTGITSGLDEKVNMTDGRANYANGPMTSQEFLTSALDKLQRRDKALAGMEDMINLQALGQLSNVLSTEESSNPLDILKNISMQGTAIALPALSAKKKLELKRTDPTTDLAFAKALRDPSSASRKVYEMKKDDLNKINKDLYDVEMKIKKATEKGDQKAIEQLTRDKVLLQESKNLVFSTFKTDEELRSELLLKSAGTGYPITEKEIQDIIDRVRGNSEGGMPNRVNRRMGSDDDGELPPDPTEPVNPFKPKPIKPLGDGKMAVDDTPRFELRSLTDLLSEFEADNRRSPNSIDELKRYFYNKYGPDFLSKIDQAIANESKDVAMETKGQGKGNQVFDMLRARLPQEITDDVVQLISYNKEAFADFASIKNQEDVTSFNEKYGVQLVIDVATV